MIRALVMTLTVLVLLLGPSSTSLANLSNLSHAINSFVEALYPKGSHFFWVINDTTTESKKEILVDINTTLQGEANIENAQQRFLLLLINGELFAAQKIPLGANVDCKQEEEV